MATVAVTSLVAGAGACLDGARSRSTCTALLPGRTVRWASPATTSTSSGGRTVLVVVTAGLGLGGSMLAGRSRRTASCKGVFLFGAGAELSAAGAWAADPIGGVACAFGGNKGRASASCVSGNQKSRSRYRTNTRDIRSNASATSIRRRCRGEFAADGPGRSCWPDFGTPVFWSSIGLKWTQSPPSMPRFWPQIPAIFYLCCARGLPPLKF